jgi:uncharacterized protein (TIGR02300 family)
LAKPEWGTKRICPSCGTRYYDLLRDPIVCPKCSTPFDPEAFLRARRARPPAPVEKELEPVGTEEVEGDLETEEIEAVEEEEDADVALEEAEEEDEELIEDASELGEDEDDMAEVIDNVEEEEP